MLHKVTVDWLLANIANLLVAERVVIYITEIIQRFHIHWFRQMDALLTPAKTEATVRWMILVTTCVNALLGLVDKTALKVNLHWSFYDYLFLMQKKKKDQTFFS